MDLIGLIEQTASREELVKLLRVTEEHRQRLCRCIAEIEAMQIVEVQAVIEKHQLSSNPTGQART